MSSTMRESGRLSRRGFIGGVAASAAAAILAACGGSSSPTATTGAAAATKPASTTGATTTGSATTGSTAATTAPATTGSTAATTAPATTSASGSAVATARPATGASAVTGTTAPSGSAVAGGSGTTTAASSGPIGMLPPPGDKFKGQTLQMISRQEYFKGTETALDGALADWMKLSGSKVENNRVNEDTGDVVSKLDASVKANNPAADLVYVDRFLSQLYQLGDIVDVSDVVAQMTDLFGPPEDVAKISLFIDGKWLGVPYFTNANGWFGRKDWLDEKGIKLSDVKTLENMRDAALAISDPSKNRFGWGLTTNTGGDGTATVTAVVNAWGGSVISDDGQKVVFNSPETVAGITWLADIYTNAKWKNMLPPGVLSWTDPSNNEAWLAGTVGFTQNAYTLYAKSKADNNPVYDKTAVIPGFTGPAADRVINSPGVGYFCVLKGSKNIPLAKATAMYLASGSALLNVVKPSVGLLMPAYKKLWDSDPFYTNGDSSFPAVRQLVEAQLPIKTKTGYNFPQSPSPIYEQAVNGQHILNQMMSDIIQKGTKPADAVKATHDQLVTAANQLGIKQ